MTLSMIIPNYNGAEILKENLPRILEIAKPHQASIIITDDFSSDNSVTWLEKTYELVRHPVEGRDPSIGYILERKDDTLKVVTKTKNEGFSSTVNLGVSQATTDLVLLLNSDAVPHLDAIAKTLPYFTDPKTFAVGLKDIDDDEQTHGQGTFIWHEGFLLHQGGSGKSDQNGKYRTGWVSGGSGVFRRSIWNELGGLDPIFNPFYFEDVDLGYRAWKAGYLNYFEPTALCDHLHKKGAIKSNYDQERIRTINIRNQFLFSWLNLTDPQLLQDHMLHIPRHILIAIKNQDRAFLKGLIQASKKLSEVRQHRASRRSLNAMIDREIIAML